MKRDALIIAAAIAVIAAIILLRAGVFSDKSTDTAADESAETISADQPATGASVLKRPGESIESTDGVLRRPGQGGGAGGVLKRPTDAGGGNAAGTQRPVRR
jgi:hypothetical protein